MALCFGVGILVGGRACGTSPVEPVVAEVEVPGPERVVYECPPDAGTAAGEQAEAQPDAVEPAAPRGKKLPDAPPPITPRERQRLLAWVRDQSADLDGCRSSSKETYRLTVTLELNEDGAVRQVRFNAPTGELPSNVRGCLRDRMTRWKPPTDLVKERRELVFGLTL